MRLERTEVLRQSTSGTDILDLTPEVSRFVADTGIEDGWAMVFVPGSTGAVTTIEYESGCLEDLRSALERLASIEDEYVHNLRWGDGNGYSHVRAALMSPSLTIPIHQGSLELGTWQQIVLCDFDNRPRRRRIVVEVMEV